MREPNSSQRLRASSAAPKGARRPPESGGPGQAPACRSRRACWARSAWQARTGLQARLAYRVRLTLVLTVRPDRTFTVVRARTVWCLAWASRRIAALSSLMPRRAGRPVAARL